MARIAALKSRNLALLVGIAGLSAAAAAQTNVTTSGGTANAVPKFSDSSTLVNSVITESNGNVGIGTTVPSSPLTISNAVSAKLDLTGSANQNGILLDRAGSADQYYLGAGNNLWASGDQGFIILDVAGSAAKFFVNGTGDVSIPTGNFGIGTTSPGARLDVTGSDATPQASGTQISTPTYPQLLLNATTGGSDAKLWRIIGRASNDFEIQTLNDTYGGEVTAMQINRSGTAINNVIFPGGNVGIGTPSPQYRLSVNGTIQAKEVLVNSGWADYVFQPEYRVTPLTEVAAFIKSNHHLPDIPSEAEVKQNGVSLGEMQARLLAKIEELTLQMIQLDEKNRALEKEVVRMQSSRGGRSGKNGGK